MRIISIFIAAALAVFGQSTCDIPFQLDATHQTVQFNNQTKACYNWQVTYYNTGFSALSIQFESAPTGASSNVPGTWVAFAGTTLSGSNPATTTTQATATFAGSFPFVRIRLVSQTGTGVVTGRVLGAQLTNAIQLNSPFNSSANAFSLPMHPVNPSLYSWVNQATATETAGNSLIGPSHRTLTSQAVLANSNSARMRSTIATPWTYDLIFEAGAYNNNNFPTTGLCIYDSGTTRMTIFGTGGNFNTFVADYTDPNTFSANFQNNQPTGDRGRPFIYRYINDGANEFYLMSQDGESFFQVGTRAAGAFVANQNQVGYCVNRVSYPQTYSMLVYSECLYSSAVGLPLGTATCQ